METDQEPSESSIRFPWSDPTSICQAFAQRALGCERLLVAVIDPRSPAADEVLLHAGWSDSEVWAWITRRAGSDALLGAALDSGLALSAAGASRSSLQQSGALMMMTLPEQEARPGAPGRRWLLAMSRQQPLFDWQDRERATLLLRRWQCGFGHVAGPHEMRLLLGRDGRVLLSDLCTRELPLRDAAALPAMIEQLGAVLRQRWPEPAPRQWCDAVLTFGSRPWWFREQQRNVLSSEPHATQTLLQGLALDPDDLPAVGLVQNPRVAAAIAQFHDHYRDAPSLKQVAQAVHVSSFHFHRLFSREVGLSPREYLQAKQLQMARWLLRSTSWPISRVAREAGYASHGHFTSTFRRTLGRSPREFREGA